MSHSAGRKCPVSFSREPREILTWAMAKKKRGPEHLPQGSGPHQVGPHGLHHYLGRLMVQATPKAGDSITELHNVVSRARTTLRLFRLKLITWAPVLYRCHPFHIFCSFLKNKFCTKRGAEHVQFTPQFGTANHQQPQLRSCVNPIADLRV